MLWRRYQLIADSGGAGHTRGGLALDQLMEFPYGPGTLSCIGDREVFGPPGAFGGGPGALAGLIVNKGSENARNIGVFCSGSPVEPGETVSFVSAGGGATATPWSAHRCHCRRYPRRLPLPRRRPRPVRRRRARPRPRRLDYEVDAAATAQLRDQMRAAR